MKSVLFRSLLLGITMVFGISCGGDASYAPTAPSGNGVGGRTGAVIVGQVINPSTPATSRSTPGMLETAGTLATADSSSVTVKVAGTNISTTTNGQGQFTLTGVPPGEVRLEFTGPGGSATISISGVKADEEIRITVTLNGSHARVDSEHRNHRGDNNGPTKVGDDEDTDEDSDEDTDEDTERVRTGPINPTGPTGPTQTEVKGAVSGLTGTCPKLSFAVIPRGASTKIAVTTSETTRFEDVRCAAIKNDMVVEVTGVRQGDSIAATKVEGD
jgi:hypothetical protein